MKFLSAIVLHIIAVFVVMHLVHIIVDDHKHLLTNALYLFTCIIFPLLFFITSFAILMREKNGYIVSLFLYNMLNGIIILAYPHISRLL